MTPRPKIQVGSRPATAFFDDEQSLSVLADFERPRKRSNMGIQRLNVGDDYTPEELEFLRAIQAWKFKNPGKMPTWAQVLELARGLGYRKVEDPSNEAPDAAREDQPAPPRKQHRGPYRRHARGRKEDGGGRGD